VNRYTGARVSDRIENPEQLDLSIIIPTLNEAGNIGPLVTRCRSTISGLGLNAEILVVDGGSLDGTVQEATDAGGRVIQQQGPRLRRRVADGLRRRAGPPRADNGQRSVARAGSHRVAVGGARSGRHRDRVAVRSRRRRRNAGHAGSAEPDPERRVHEGIPGWVSTTSRAASGSIVARRCSRSPSTRRTSTCSKRSSF
jgi:hypothetical protein